MKISSTNNSIVYTDTPDHFENGLLRLLSMTQSDFQQWLQLSSQSNKKELLYRLTDGFQNLRPFFRIFDSLEVEPGPNGERGKIWFPSIVENPNYGIAISEDKTIGWLVRQENNKYVRETSPPVYEEEYFEGDPTVAGGYANYATQEGWRLEKARKQVAKYITGTVPSGARVLDIGSGYGYFRKALGEAGFKHYGLEVSLYANAVSKKMYGFNTLPGFLSDWYLDFLNSFDAVMLGDLIEHVADPIAFLKEVKAVLKPGGFAIFKTPNIDCPEVEIFGPHYHSLKREHLVYFTAEGLTSYAQEAGFSPYLSQSVSHLLTGFVGKETTDQWASSLRGTDLIIQVRK